MIEQDVYSYFQQNTTLSGLVGDKIFLIVVPTDDLSTLPWVTIEQTSGTRKKISQLKMEEIAYLRITVDAGPDQLFKGRQIIEHCKKLLENYRGTLDLANDVCVETGAIRGWAGFGNAYRYQFDATARFTEDLNKPGAV